VVASELEIARGVYDAPVSIPAKGKGQVKLPVSVDAKNAMKLAKELLTSTEELFAVLTATADFETPVGAMEVSFEDKKPLKALAGM
jgi:LEA14-like dessication related protein